MIRVKVLLSDYKPSDLLGKFQKNFTFNLRVIKTTLVWKPEHVQIAAINIQ